MIFFRACICGALEHAQFAIVDEAARLVVEVVLAPSWHLLRLDGLAELLIITNISSRHELPSSYPTHLHGAGLPARKHGRGKQSRPWLYQALLTQGQVGAYEVTEQALVRERPER